MQPQDHIARVHWQCERNKYLFQSMLEECISRNCLLSCSSSQIFFSFSSAYFLSFEFRDTLQIEVPSGLHCCNDHLHGRERRYSV